MPASDRDLNVLYQLARILQKEELSPTDQIEILYSYLFENEGFPSRKFEFSPLLKWDKDALNRAIYSAEELISLYTFYFYDPRIIPVTYYQKEKRIRRHLDHQFSKLFKELIRRQGQELVLELIIEEPIYYLKQQVRERSFPKVHPNLKKMPKSRKVGLPKNPSFLKQKRASLELLKSRFHLALQRRLEI